MTRNIVILFLCLIPFNSFSAEKLAYHSDYFSFVGRDNIGFVAFAIDNNRGVDGTNYQAENFGVLYDQQSGWVKLLGTGDYDNVHGLLEQIPDSLFFYFEGHATTGLVIRSKENLLTLKIDPLINKLTESRGKRTIKWGVARAVLYWKDRKIPGRIIHEQLVHLDWNRLTRKYANTWDNFQGFYLALDKGTPATWQDLYLRSEGAGNNRRSKGFTTLNDWIVPIYSTSFEAYDKALNFGFFRWPQRWTIEVKPKSTDNSTPGQLTLHQVSRENQGNWIIGGFAMTVVKGELFINGTTIPVLGFVELIK